MKILIGRLIRVFSSGFPLFANACPNHPNVRNYLTLPLKFELQVKGVNRIHNSFTIN